MQSRKSSLIEAVVNVMTGMVLSFSITQLVAPLLDIKISMHSNLLLTLILTCVSITRSYLWRRYFNKGRGNKNE